MVELDKEELLAKARRDYPPGTYFECIFGKKDSFTSDSDSPFDYCWDEDEQHRIILRVKEKTTTYDNAVGIYSKYEGWAKILKTAPIPIYELW